ncbi:hypothetical protein N7U66_07495 [Lacinutrix neustonica]|uniref:Uncharacterized protein n=1 Tax=Lacinutrix neustonica TaxID=2980107 RepID=A0A9E8MXH7_9FLAO|nr:hypothetical protein [Lacinutrix neustonica]WAC03368.1 hypothetical protein N7U66_07495 [Lacinutrix neustonica]
MTAHLPSKHLLKIQYLLLILLFAGVTTHVFAQETDKEISKSIYLTSNIGLDKNFNANTVLKAIVDASQKDSNAAFVALGNSTRSNGYPRKY